MSKITFKQLKQRFLDIGRSIAEDMNVFFGDEYFKFRR